MQAIVSIVYHLELTDEELANEHLVRTLTSFRFIRVNFVYHKNPAEYHYEALRCLAWTASLDHDTLNRIQTQAMDT